MRDPPRPRRGALAWPRPVRPAVMRLAYQERAGSLHAALRVADSETRPPGEIVNRSRTPGREIAAREVVQRLVPVAWRRRGDALVEQRIGNLFPSPRAADDDAVDLGL